MIGFLDPKYSITLKNVIYTSATYLIFLNINFKIICKIAIPFLKIHYAYTSSMVNLLPTHRFFKTFPEKHCNVNDPKQLRNFLRNDGTVPK